ncbi:MAG: DciA family protein, partial [Cyanobacteriota bacterium]
MAQSDLPPPASPDKTDSPRRRRRISSGRERRGRKGELQSRRIGNLSVLLPPAAAPASAVGRCLEQLQQQWQREGHLAALWQAWPRLAGPQLAPHCRPQQLPGAAVGSQVGPREPGPGLPPRCPVARPVPRLLALLQA